MGRESSCTARLDGKASPGKALLETEELLFRGAAFRVVVPFKSMTRVESNARDLTIVWPGGTLVLPLGAEAARWADKIRNPPSRADKLGVKAGMRVALRGAVGRDRDFIEELGTRGAEIDIGAGAGRADLVFLSADGRADLDRLARLKERIAPDGAIWVLRAKQGSGVGAEITELDVMAAGRAAGLVDVKVVAFSRTHSAAKLVIPVAQRAAAKVAVATSSRALRPTRAKARSPRRGRSTT
jgi:hypothetical protein